jgi:AP-1 complex subunit sigma 1/2
LDRYFGNVCELDLIFNFHKAYYILDELLIAGVAHDQTRFGQPASASHEQVLHVPAATAATGDGMARICVLALTTAH